MATKSWRAHDNTHRIWVRSIVEGMPMPNAHNYVHMTVAQEASLEVLNRKEIRIITGLPATTSIEDLQALA